MVNLFDPIHSICAISPSMVAIDLYYLGPTPSAPSIPFFPKVAGQS